MKNIMRSVNSNIVYRADLFHNSSEKYFAHEYFREFEPTIPSIIHWLNLDKPQVVV